MHRLNHLGKHKRNMVIWGVKLSGKEPSAIKLTRRDHSIDMRLHYHYIHTGELRWFACGDYYCCNLSGGVALIVWFTMNRMCVKNNTKKFQREQAIVREIASMISVVACCHGAKLCAHAARDIGSQQNGAATRMWRSCQGQPSHKEGAIGTVRCKKEGMLLQPLRWCCVDCVIHHEREVREE